MPASQYLSTLKEEGFMESWVCLFKCLWIVDTSVAWVFHTPAFLHLPFVMLLPPPPALLGLAYRLARHGERTPTMTTSLTTHLMGGSGRGPRTSRWVGGPRRGMLEPACISRGREWIGV